jgi:hypothetical protein
VKGSRDGSSDPSGPISYGQDVAGGTGDPFAQPRTKRRRGGVFLAVLVMVVAFGVGAFVASKAELFPPQVEQAPPPIPGIPGAGAEQRWRGTIASATSHDYRSGGTCTTDWRSTFALRVDEGGRVEGDGSAELKAGPDCPPGFPTTQPQILGYGFRVAGRVTGDALRLRLWDFSPTRGATEYGGFHLTIAAEAPTIEIPLSRPDEASAREILSYEGPDGQDASRSRNVIRMSCPRCGS